MAATWCAVAGLAWTLMVPLSLSATEPEVADAAAALEAFKRAQLWRDHMAYRGKTNTVARGVEQYETSQHTSTEFIHKQDGDRYELRGSIQANMGTDVATVYDLMIVRPGDLTIEFNGARGSQTRARAEEDFSARRSQLAGGQAYQGIFEGYHYGSGGLNVSDLLAASSNLTLASSGAETEGRRLPVLTGTSPYGRVEVTLDPSNGFHACRIVIEKGPGDLFDDQQLPMPNDAFDNALSLERLVYTLDNVSFTRVDGVSIPSAGTYVVQHYMSDGSVREWRSSMSRSDIEVEPDFTNAFQVDLPNGTPVVFNDGPRASGVQFEWQNGKITPAIDKDALASIESVVEAESVGNRPPATAAHTTRSVVATQHIPESTTRGGNKWLIVVLLGAGLIITIGMAGYLKWRSHAA